MADKMLRVAGRGDDGTAKPFKLNNDGALYVNNVNHNIEKSNKASLIDALDYNAEVIEMSYQPYNLRVLDVDKNGRIYAGRSHYIHYSDDDGKTWSTSISNESTPTVRRLIALDNGELLQVGVSGQIWKSDTSLGNWRLVLNSVGGTVLDEGSLSAYENVVLASNYGSGLEFLQVWISTDYGNTWKNILKSSEPVGFNHMHAVAYDPYENLIWACSGDDYGDYKGKISRIWYSADFGVNWEYFHGVRSTGIIPLPDRVLFLSDVLGRKSVFSFERPKRGTNTIRDNRPTNYLEDWGFTSSEQMRPPHGIKEIFFAQVHENEVTATTWGSVPYVKYGKGFKAIFGFFTAADLNKPIEIWGTTTGEDFIPVWSSKQIVKGGIGIGGVFGDEDKLVAATSLPNSEGVITPHMIILRPNK